jgi:hypothetical protein
MDTNETILGELRVIFPIVASVSREDVFVVPDRYFDMLPDRIMGKILIVGLGNAKNSPLTIPIGYFNNLSSTILNKIKFQQSESFSELEEIAPLLNTISKQPVYSVPDKYFQNFNVKIVPAKKKKLTATIVSFHNTRKWISYAAAAVMAGLLVTGAFLYTDRPASFDLSKEVNKLSDDELNSYINYDHSVVITPDSINLGSSTDVQSNLKLVSDEELKQYLENNPETVPFKDRKGS